MNKKVVLIFLATLAIVVGGGYYYGWQHFNRPVSDRGIPPFNGQTPQPLGVTTTNINEQPTNDEVTVAKRAKKICQLIGDTDRERDEPTRSLTQTRYKVLGTDNGVPFTHNGGTYLLFGDTAGVHSRENRLSDSIAYTTDTNPEQCLKLDFISGSDGAYQPIVIPGVTTGAFEVPIEGVSVDDTMYLYYTTDTTSQTVGGQITQHIGRTIVAVSQDNGKTFRSLYDLSKLNFLMVSIVEVEAADWPGLPWTTGKTLVIFGGQHSRDSIYLAVQPKDKIEDRSAIRYFSGVDAAGQPRWSTEESAAVPAITNLASSAGFSVSYNTFINKWLFLDHTQNGSMRGITMRTADRPWSAWSKSQILFNPVVDNGYCHFIHAPAKQRCDTISDPTRNDTPGGEYGPFQFEHFAMGSGNATTIYFTMSTWNPYTVILMTATLEKK